MRLTDHLLQSGQFIGIISLQDLVLDMVWRPEERSHTAQNLTRQVRDVFALREEAKHLWIFQATDSLATVIGRILFYESRSSLESDLFDIYRDLLEWRAPRFGSAERRHQALPLRDAFPVGRH